MRHVSSDELERLLPMAVVIDLMREAFGAHAEGATHLPDRTALPGPGSAGVVLVMPAGLPRRRALGLKVVSVFPDNPRLHGLPVISGTVFVVDPETGAVTLSLDGTWVTAKRTGAVTGLATDLLARRDATRLLVFGTGPQARTQIEAVCTVRAITQVVVCGTSRNKADAFVARHGPPPGLAAGTTWRAGEGGREDVAAADVIVTATSSRTPVFDGRWLRPGTHVAAIGSFTPQVRELDTATVTRGRVFVDDLDHAWREAGDLRIPEAEGVFDRTAVCGDLADLVSGRRGGRLAVDDVTVFKSVGLAIEDVIVGAWVREALAMPDE